MPTLARWMPRRVRDDTRRQIFHGRLHLWNPGVSTCCADNIVAGMSDFDVEWEAADWCTSHGMLVPNNDEERKSRWTYDDIKDLLTRCRDATEEECIKASCRDCEDGDKPVLILESPIDGTPAWWHEYPGREAPDPFPPEGEYCTATVFHERRRRRGEPK